MCFLKASALEVACLSSADIPSARASHRPSQDAKEAGKCHSWLYILLTYHLIIIDKKNRVWGTTALYHVECLDKLNDYNPHSRENI